MLEKAKMLLREKKPDGALNVMEDILNVLESNMIVSQKKGCRLIFANTTARKQLEKFNIPNGNCKTTFADIFPGICEFCNNNSQTPTDIKDMNGRAFSLSAKAVDWPDGGAATLFILDDVEEERNATKMLFNLAYFDYLTQIPNRRKLKEDFKELEAEIAAKKKSGMVAIFDLDHFKKVNDTYGHNTGDLMLQRLTQHLQSNPAYEGHLYRLGGDEFAFLYVDDINTYPDPKAHYEQLLQGAIKSYTLPNIHISCEISIGAAFFPEHGQDLYTLLRKSDIALYKAKAAGRNRLVLFESKFDIVQDFKDVYINIQPILDSGGNTFGYELTEESIGESPENTAINLTDFNRTLDIMQFDDIYNNQHYFVNYTANMLVVVEQNLLKNKFIIQIENTDHYSDEDMENYLKLKGLGFAIALNCRDISALSIKLIEIADYIKIVPNQNTIEAIKKLHVLNKDATLVATQVNDEKQLTFAKKAGCILYQGHYFTEVSKKTEKIKSVEPLRASYYKLLKLTCTDQHADFQEISRIISSDPSLSYRLLKMLNTVEFRTKNQISSITMALSFIGEQRLKKWIALMSLRGISPDKPLELIRVSLIRARFGELLALNVKVEKYNSDHVFMVGMLSLLHVALDKTQEELFEEISVAEDIRQSLLGKTGKYSDLLVFFKNYEQCDWEEIAKFAKKHDFSTHVISESYIEATKWCNELMDER